MKIKIGSARIDENGRISGGVAGDQTGREVAEQDFYMHSKGWYMLRPKDPFVAEKIAEAMRQACANDHIGYDQNNRISVVTNVKIYGTLQKIQVPTESDCGTLIRACIYQATGVDVGDFYTGNEVAVLEQSGIFEKAKSVSSSADVYNGDVLVTKKKGHTVAITSGRSRITSSESNSKVLAWQNAAIADGFQFPKYGADGEWGSECEEVAKKAIVKLRKQGKNYIYKYPNLTKIVQAAVGEKEDGKFGTKSDAATKEFQGNHGLVQDGDVGLLTWKMILGV